MHPDYGSGLFYGDLMAGFRDMELQPGQSLYPTGSAIRSEADSMESGVPDMRWEKD